MQALAKMYVWLAKNSCIKVEQKCNPYDVAKTNKRKKKLWQVVMYIGRYSYYTYIHDPLVAGTVD